LYQIDLDELSTPQKVDPQAQDSRQLLSWLILKAVVQHGLEAVETSEHGEQQCV
jgi:hypothetical protein